MNESDRLALLWESPATHLHDLMELVEHRCDDPARQRRWRLALSAFAQRAASETGLELDERTFGILDAGIDGRIPAEEFQQFRDCHAPIHWNHVNPTRVISASNAVATAFAAVVIDPTRLWTTLHWQMAANAFQGQDAEFAVQASIFKDIFGNPFRPVAFDPRWRTEHTVGIAAKMYDDREFVAMPILADALEEAGCDSDAILTHCREPGVHVRGCWVVDLVLGKA